MSYWGEFGYDYVYALSDAIESYTKKAVSNNPEAFAYHGASLMYAAERALYFGYSANPSLIGLYDDLRTGRFKKEYVFKDELESILARELIQISNTSANKSVKISYRTSIYGYLRPIAGNIVRSIKDLINRSNNIECDGKILLYVMHDKFIRFFAPIRDVSPDNYTYLYLCNSNLRNKLNCANLSSIALTPIGWSQKKLSSESQLTSFPHLLMQFNLFYQNLSKCRPRAILVPEGNAPEYEIINQVCRLLGIPVICIQNGWAPYVHNGFRNLSFTKMLVWGEGFVELLKPYNPHQKFVVTGSYLIKKNKDSMALASDNIKKGVGFFLQAPSQLISNECWNNFLELIRWTSKEFSEISVYIREHPSYSITEEEKLSLTRFFNVVFANPSDWTLDKFFIHTKISIAVHSSTILESIAAGVLPVIYNETPMPRYFPDADVHHAAIEVKTLAEAKDILAKLMNETIQIDDYKDSMRAFSDKFFYCDGQDALNRTINEIEETINEKLA